MVGWLMLVILIVGFCESNPDECVEELPIERELDIDLNHGP